MTTAQDQQSRAECRKAFEFELIDNHMYVQSDLEQVDGFYVDDDVQFAWHASWAVWQAARALPEGMEPFGYWHQGPTDDESDFHLHAVSGDVSCANCVKLYTAAQVLAMGRVPPGCMAVPVELLQDAEQALANFVSEHDWGDADMVAMDNLSAALAAAPQPPAAPVVSQQLTAEQIRKWWASENGLEDFDMGKLVDFTMVVREVESKLGITHPTGD